jgi:hypothetical protein
MWRSVTDNRGLLPYKPADLIDHVFFNLFCNIAPGTERKEFPLIAIHVGKAEFLFALHNLDIEFFCNIQDNGAWNPRGDQDITDFFFGLRAFMSLIGFWLV